MNFIFHDLNGKKIAELPLGELNINSLQDSIDMIGNAHYLGSSSVVIYKECLSPDFFKLSSGLAGDILQKISNYNLKLAIVGNFSEYTSKSLRDFIYESNKTGRVLFVPDLDSALLEFAK